jgi:mRNA-degrading endonuclease toxin of MazEF toxin-antitoxin module
MDTYSKVKKGEIYLVAVRFSDRIDAKIRPVLIVFEEETEQDVIGAFLTSQRVRNQYDLPIKKWRESGLEKPSVIRTSKLGTYHRSLLIQKIGVLNAPELNDALSTCRSLFN